MAALAQLAQDNRKGKNMTTYIIQQGGESSIDRTKLQYPCKIVDLEGGEEYYYMTAESTRITTSVVPDPVEPEIVTLDALNSCSDGDLVLGLSVSGTSASLVGLTYNEYGTTTAETLRTVVLSSPLSFNGEAFFYIEDEEISLIQNNDSGPVEVGESDEAVKKAIEKIVSILGYDFGDNSVVTATGYQLAYFAMNSTEDNHGIHSISVRGPFVEKYSESGTSKVLVKSSFGTFGRLDGTSSEAYHFRWMIAGTDEYGNVVYSTPE
jgi:hypothetical protein